MQIFKCFGFYQLSSSDKIKYISNQLGTTMICKRCHKRSASVYCQSCSKKIFEKRVLKHARTFVKSGSTLKGDKLTRKILSKMHCNVSAKGNKLANHSMDEYVGYFLNQIFTGKKPRPLTKASVFEVVTKAQISDYSKDYEVGSDNVFMRQLEKRFPGSLNACYNAIKKYKKHILHIE